MVSRYPVLTLSPVLRCLHLTLPRVVTAPGPVLLKILARPLWRTEIDTSWSSSAKLVFKLRKDRTDYWNRYKSETAHRQHHDHHSTAPGSHTHDRQFAKTVPHFGIAVDITFHTTHSYDQETGIFGFYYSLPSHLHIHEVYIGQHGWTIS